MKRILALAVAVAASTIVLSGTTPAHAASKVAPQRDTATAGFTGTPNGISYFRETKNQKSIKTQGIYFGLVPGNQYFTVIYANDNCDPAQAFPVGPFRANSQGIGRINKRTPNPNGVDVGKVSSISVRNADANGNVIAVPGQPAIGLVQCNSNPTLGVKR